MSLEIWTGVAWAKGGYGGWAHVRFGEAEAQGAAGGDRSTTPLRMALTGAIEALEAAGPEAAPVRLYSPGTALPLGRPDDEEDRDLWDRLAKLTALRPTTFIDSASRAEDVTAVFVHGWAEFTLNIAKTKGAFQAAVPKPNLKALVAKRAG